MDIFHWCSLLVLFSLGKGEETTTEPNEIFQEDIEDNPTHVNGEELFEGDILLLPEQRKGVPHEARLWPADSNGIVNVPYRFQDGSVNQEAVGAALSHWEEHTCIRFQKVVSPNGPHLGFFLGDGCHSYVGRIDKVEGQGVSIGKNCNKLGTVAHEIGHAMGFFHEQSRSDRDQYVHINLENTASNFVNNFEKRVDDSHGVPYDYSSDLHYGGRYFTINGHNTIVTLDPLKQGIIGQRTGLSHYDKLLANKMYRCIETWLAKCNLASDPCKNDGYTTYDGSACKCVCPSGTAGANCETVTGDYYASVGSSCSEKITTETTVTTPNYPNNFAAGLKCSKLIEAPEGKVVQLTFDSFQFYKMTESCKNNTMCCYYDVLQIRKSPSDYDGEWFCDNMIAPGMVFTSCDRQMILYFKAGTNVNKGFSARIKFVSATSACPASSTTSTTTITTSTTSTTTTPPTTTTTTTTVPTTTTTTPTTTKPTTTSTTTTSSTTAPTTVSTSTTTAALPLINPRCNLVPNVNSFSWTSPLFGQSDYPNDASCYIGLKSNRPKRSRITLEEFDLQTPSNGQCHDHLTVNGPYRQRFNMCGKKQGTIEFPTSNFNMKFSSDSSITEEGFNITISNVPSRCHQVIKTGRRRYGTLYTPKYPNYDRSVFQACEWWIRAPRGKRIKVYFQGWRSIVTCRTGDIFVNLNGDNKYPRWSSASVCKRFTRSIKSNRNQMNIVFSARRPNFGFKATWIVV